MPGEVRSRGTGAVALVVVLLLVVAGRGVGTAGAAPAAPPPVPVLSAPPAGLKGHPLWDSYYDLSAFGYEEQELFVTGTAADAGGATAPYTTRIIVTRPADPARFNGVVLLDWVNVTAQFENAVDTMLAREMLMREGFAYVHVSAQEAGVCCLPQLTPKMWDPVRYAALDHPGDAFSFDIVTQIARAFEAPGPGGSLDPMGDLGIGSVDHVLAAGQSQSAIRLHEYLETWLPTHPDAVGVIDGVLVHGDVGKSKSFGPPLPIPVLHLLSDFEAVDDGVDPAGLDPNVRLWEIAGTSHADLFIGYQSIFGHGPRVLADLPPVSEPRFREIIDAAGNYGERIDALGAVCVAAGATFPMHYAASTAIHELAAWVAGGEPPESGPRFEFAGGALAMDEHGNTQGGIRLPPIDVPVATYQSTLCQLGGITVPFLDTELHELYPTHADYYGKMAARSDAAVAAGWLLPEDAADLMRRACAASIRWLPPQEPCAPYEPPAFRVALPVATPVAPAAPDAPAVGADRLPATGSQPPVPAALALVAASVGAHWLGRRAGAHTRQGLGGGHGPI